MYGVFELDPWEWRLLHDLNSDGENKSLTPGVGKGTVEKALSKGLIERWTKGSGRYATNYWRRTAVGQAAFEHDDRLHRSPPPPWGTK